MAVNVLTYVYSSTGFHIPQTQPEPVPHKQTPGSTVNVTSNPCRKSEYQADVLHAYRHTTAFLHTQEVSTHPATEYPPARRPPHTAIRFNALAQHVLMLRSQH